VPAKHDDQDVKHALEGLLTLLRGRGCSELDLLRRFVGLQLVITVRDHHPDIREGYIRAIGDVCGVHLQDAIFDGLQGTVLAHAGEGRLDFCSADVAEKVREHLGVLVFDQAEYFNLDPTPQNGGSAQPLEG